MTESRRAALPDAVQRDVEFSFMLIKPGRLPVLLSGISCFVLLLMMVLTPPPPPVTAQCESPTQTSVAPDSYTKRASEMATWIIKNGVRTTGAIIVNPISPSPFKIVPYFSNVAAMGLVQEGTYLKQVQDYLVWYVGHLNLPDRFGRRGTVYDYDIKDGLEVPTQDYDSADAYGGTFLTLARRWYEANPTAHKAFILSQIQNLQLIGDMILALQQPDGLTWVKDSYAVKLLIDNAEAFAGLRDLAMLGQEVGMSADRIQKYTQGALLIERGINQSLWDPANNNYLVGLQADGGRITAKWTTWYPDAVAQLTLIADGVGTRIPYSEIYARFQKAQPGWSKLNNVGDFGRQGDIDSPQHPWVLVGYVARLMGDDAAWMSFSDGITKKFLNGAKPYAWPWNTADAGTYLLVNTPTLILAQERPFGDNGLFTTGGCG